MYGGLVYCMANSGSIRFLPSQTKINICATCPRRIPAAGLRIAYFKLFFPAEFYRCYLVRNAKRFDTARMVTQSLDELRAALTAIRKRDCIEPADAADDEGTVLEVLIEMNLRGIYVRTADISHFE